LNTFYSGARIGSIDFEDLWFMFHQKWLNMNLLVIFCLLVHSRAFNSLNTFLVFFYLNTISWYDTLLPRMQFMDNVKLGGRSTIRILDPTCANQVSHTINLRKESEMYKDMTIKEFEQPSGQFLGLIVMSH
jgi:hypothetical protein